MVQNTCNIGVNLRFQEKNGPDKPGAVSCVAWQNITYNVYYDILALNTI
jgi:hypothetical protein